MSFKAGYVNDLQPVTKRQDRQLSALPFARYLKMDYWLIFPKLFLSGSNVPGLKAA